MHLASRLTALLLVLTTLLSGCGVQSQSVPINDPDGIKTVAATLSPWKDGSPDRSEDKRTPGEPGSDRRLFLTWLQRYYIKRQYGQYERDYVPQTVPGSVAEVIAEERVTFEKDQAADQARRVQVQQEQRQQSAREREGQVRSEQHWAAEEAKARASEVAGELRNRVETEAAAERSAARQRCLDQRQNAALSANAADYQRVWNSFPACERMP